MQNSLNLHFFICAVINVFPLSVYAFVNKLFEPDVLLYGWTWFAMDIFHVYMVNACLYLHIFWFYIFINIFLYEQQFEELCDYFLKKKMKMALYISICKPISNIMLCFFCSFRLWFGNGLLSQLCSESSWFYFGSKQRYGDSADSAAF